MDCIGSQVNSLTKVVEGLLIFFEIVDIEYSALVVCYIPLWFQVYCLREVSICFILLAQETIGLSTLDVCRCVREWALYQPGTQTLLDRVLPMSAQP